MRIRTITSTLVLCPLFFSSLACDGKKAETKAENKAENKAEAKAEKPSAKPQPASKAPEKKEAAKNDGLVVVDETVKNPLTPANAKQLTADAMAAVEGIGAARKAIASDSKKAAKKALSDARSAIDRVITQRPTIGVAVSLWEKDRELEEETSQSTVDTIPIFTSLDRVEEHIASPDDIRDEKAKRIKSGKDATVADKHGDIDLIDANLIYTEVDLPVAATHVRLLAAQKLVSEGKLKEADAILAEAENTLEALQVVQKAPEVVARQAIWDGEAAFARGDLKEAKALLTEANTVLDTLRSNPGTDDETKKFATALVEEIEPLVKTLEPGDESHASILQKVKRRVWSLAQRASARSSLIKHRGDVAYALADALMYLELSQLEGLYEGVEGSGGDLVLARIKLEEAAEEVAPATKPRLTELALQVHELISLDVARKRDSAAVRDLHEAIKFDLRRLMFDLWLPS